jgi:hypothetical protein
MKLRGAHFCTALMALACDQLNRFARHNGWSRVRIAHARIGAAGMMWSGRAVPTPVNQAGHAPRFCYGVDTVPATATLFSMRGSRLVRTLSPKALSIVGLLLAALNASSVRAEVSVQGPATDVRVEARGATVAEILAALGERFELRFRGQPANRPVTATFAGPLRRVLARVLDGNDYVIESRGTGVEVIVLGVGAPRQALPPVPAAIVRRRVD